MYPEAARLGNLFTLTALLVCYGTIPTARLAIGCGASKSDRRLHLHDACGGGNLVARDRANPSELDIVLCPE